MRFESGRARTAALALVTLILAVPPAALGKRHPHARPHGHNARFLTAQRLNHGLQGSPMAHLGFEFEAAGWHYHISPYFMAAIAGTESSLGRATCPGNPKNVWGLASCSQSWHVPYFASWRQAIHFFAYFLRSHWPRATTAYHYYGYAACSSCWGSHTAYFMRALFGAGPSVVYP